MENLHTQATKLKHLEFINPDVYTDDVLQDQTIYHPLDLGTFS